MKYTSVTLTKIYIPTGYISRLRKIWEENEENILHSQLRTQSLRRRRKRRCRVMGGDHDGNLVAVLIIKVRSEMSLSHDFNYSARLANLVDLYWIYIEILNKKESCGDF